MKIVRDGDREWKVVKVEQVHIDTGQPGRGGNCPLYNAMKDSGIEGDIHVGAHAITINCDPGCEPRNENEFIFDHTHVTQTWISNFDKGNKDKVYPFVIYLDFENGIMETYT